MMRRKKKGDAKEEEGRCEGGRSCEGDLLLYFSFLFFSFVVRKEGLRGRGKRDETRVGVVGPCE